MYPMFLYVYVLLHKMTVPVWGRDAKGIGSLSKPAHGRYSIIGDPSIRVAKRNYTPETLKAKTFFCTWLRSRRHFVSMCNV
jgi:hypothetical protein